MNLQHILLWHQIIQDIEKKVISIKGGIFDTNNYEEFNQNYFSYLLRIFLVIDNIHMAIDGSW